MVLELWVTSGAATFLLTQIIFLISFSLRVVYKIKIYVTKNTILTNNISMYI
jgi:hypothetical protein